jgi:hypothetical protein
LEKTSVFVFRKNFYVWTRRLSYAAAVLAGTRTVTVNGRATWNWSADPAAAFT